MPQAPDQTQQKLLLTIGDLVEDIVVWPFGEVAEGTDTSARIVRRRGGSAANVAEHAARLGSPVRFVGGVGADFAGDALVADLRSAGVDVCVERRGRTGTIVVIVDHTGERTMIVDRGASERLSRVQEDWLQHVDWLHLPAYSLSNETLLTSTWYAVNRLRDKGARLSADASSVGLLAEMGVDRYATWLRAAKVDLVFANADEAALLGLGSSLSLDATVIIKQGPDPVVVIEPRQEPRYIDVPVVAEVLDTTGAGDAFAAGYLHAFRSGASIDDSVASGIRSAQSVLGVPGASTVNAPRT